MIKKHLRNLTSIFLKYFQNFFCISISYHFPFDSIILKMLYAELKEFILIKYIYITFFLLLYHKMNIIETD